MKDHDPPDQKGSKAPADAFPPTGTRPEEPLRPLHGSAAFSGSTSRALVPPGYRPAMTLPRRVRAGANHAWWTRLSAQALDAADRVGGEMSLFGALPVPPTERPPLDVGGPCLLSASATYDGGLLSAQATG